MDVTELPCAIEFGIPRGNRIPWAMMEANLSAVCAKMGLLTSRFSRTSLYAYDDRRRWVEHPLIEGWRVEYVRDDNNEVQEVKTLVSFGLLIQRRVEAEPYKRGEWFDFREIEFNDGKDKEDEVEIPLPIDWTIYEMYVLLPEEDAG